MAPLVNSRRPKELFRHGQQQLRVLERISEVAVLRRQSGTRGLMPRHAVRDPYSYDTSTLGKKNVGDIRVITALLKHPYSIHTPSSHASSP